jgi:hypothetical protein
MAKGGLIAILLLLTFFYQQSSSSSKFSNTFFSNSDHMYKAIGASALTGLIASLTTIYIMGSRGFFSMTVLLLVFAILFVYDLAQESSGVNRWLNISTMKRGEGDYADLNTITHKDTTTLQEFNQTVSNIDPFYTATTYTLLVLITVLMGYLGWIMLKSSWIGSRENSIYNSEFWGSAVNPSLGFFLELMFMGMNGLIPIVATLVRGEELTSATYINVSLFGVGSIVLQILIQYAGLYDMSLKY